MPDANLVLPVGVFESLREASRAEVESAAVLLVGLAWTPQGLRLVGRDLIWVAEDAYDVRTADQMSIRSTGYVSALARAEALSAVAIFVHTHPGKFASPFPSQWDDLVDFQLAETFRVRSQSDVFASIVVSPAEGGIAFTGRGVSGETPFQISSMLVTGERLAMIRSEGVRGLSLTSMFDRQVRAFGQDVQRVLGALTIGIVGCGGTGSAVAEQLVRLGVRRLVLMDSDDLSETNVTRVYGSTPSDVGLSKVEVLAKHLRAIAPGLEVEVQSGFLKSVLCARQLTGCDVLFGCTDDNAGRSILSRLASYYLVPLIDCGVLISSDSGVTDGIHARVTVQTPGSACLVCRGRIDVARAGAELMHVDERRKLAGEGYAPALPGVEPAVVAFTSLAASQAVIELLDLLIGFGPENRPTEILHRIHDREIGTNTREPRSGHYCDPGSSDFGRGDAEPFLGRLWSTS